MVRQVGCIFQAWKGRLDLSLVVCAKLVTGKLAFSLPSLGCPLYHIILSHEGIIEDLYPHVLLARSCAPNLNVSSFHSPFVSISQISPHTTICIYVFPVVIPSA